MLEIEKMNAYYNRIQVLKNVSLKVPEGRIVSIIGANGAGKSTFLKAVSGLIKQKSGRIMFKGQNITRMPPNRIVSLGLSQVPEGRQIFSQLSVVDNIHLGAYLYYRRRNKPEINRRIESIYSMFPVLEKRSRQMAGTLSGGEQQMLAIARALMSRPQMLLLDEPSMGIAPLIVKDIFNALRQLNEQGVTILLVEQNAQSAIRMSHYAYVLERGEIALEGIPEELMNNRKVKEVYLGG